MRERNEQAGRRPGDMQEQADAVPHPLRAQPFAERPEVVILHPDDVFFLDQPMEAVREMAVDAFIAAADLILIFGNGYPIGKGRSDRSVGLTGQIFVEVLRLEVDSRGGGTNVALRGVRVGRWELKTVGSKLE